MSNRPFLFLTAVLVSLLVQGAWGQINSLNETFSRHVKSVDELMKRFNGEELYPGLDTADAAVREKNLVLLMDAEMDQAEKNKVPAFISTVLESRASLSYESREWMAIATCDMKYKNKTLPVTLTLRTEQVKPRVFRWAVCGADGLTGQFIDTRHRAISPTEHEIHFMELKSIFHNDKNGIFGYMETSRTVDQLSVLLALIHAGAAEISTVNNLEFVFFEVPGYVFTIQEKQRRDDNAGWLISEIKCMGDTEKQQYFKKLTGHPCIQQ